MTCNNAGLLMLHRRSMRLLYFRVEFYSNEDDAKANDKVVVFTTCPYIKWGNIHAPGSVTNATLKHNDSNKTSGDYYA